MSFSHRTKRLLWERDGGVCFYCGCTLTKDTRTIDHVIPRSKGGPHRFWNLVLACQECNQLKDDNDPTPEQLDIILRRKLLQDSLCSVGQAIKIAKEQKNTDEVSRLFGLLEIIQEAIRNGTLVPPDKLKVAENIL